MVFVKDADGKTLFVSTADKTVSQLNAITSTFYLVFARKSYPVATQLDYFYERQEEDGAIRSNYDIASGKFSPQHKNPIGIGTPLFSWAEYNLYHKCLDDKKRIRRVLVILEKYWEWLESVALQENGLYAVPLAATGMHNCPRGKVKYPLDFNLQQAINAHYMAELGSTVNDKDLTFRYRKKYFGLRSQINSLMWNDKQGFYFDLDEKGKQLRTKSVAAFWSLLAKYQTNPGLSRSLNTWITSVNLAARWQFRQYPGATATLPTRAMGTTGVFSPCIPLW